MKKKRSSWIYLVLGVMLFSLITVSALPLVGSVVEGTQFAKNPNSEVVVLSQQELAKLEAEASGYQKVLEREPDNNTALSGLLKIKLQQKDIPGAIAPLEKLAKLNPEQTEYGVLLAQAKQQTEDYEGAAAAYSQILGEHPGDIYALGGITNLYLVQDLPERAIALLKKTIAVASNEDSPNADSIDRDSVELLLGELYSNQERYAEAIALYDELATANQDDFRPILAKALVLKKQGDLIAAKPILEKAYIAAPEQYKDQIGDEMEQLVKGIKQAENLKL
ncbi:tetratricopeptide repeat protein [Pleurocapsa sp. FMAR1]|uniref:tetratricopeptide repeat protein n=1 Tax=Pleurocapsa sp. FMAR1 TaxID=3040204 RepID=UPI0029C74943|nr:tetratricopeptide repeat protein [Pleurocapsa sp. FMAR1]